MTIAAPHTVASTSTAEEYAERLMSSALGWIDIMSAYLGDRLGWYRSLAEHGPSTPDQLAERTGTQPRYAREWLEQQAVSGVLLLDESEDGTRSALIADNIRGQRQVVIKSLEANYQQVPGIAAATILGDGRVALILGSCALVSSFYVVAHLGGLGLDGPGGERALAHIAILVAVVAWFVMSRSVFGFEVRTVGAAPHAARYAGFSANRTIWVALLISGGLAGLAGVLEAAGPFGRMVPQFPTNYGFTAIIVAFLGRLHPLGIILSGLVISISFVGGEVAQTTIGLPNAAVGIFQALMLFFILASDIFVRYRIKRVVPQAVESAA